MCAQKFTRSMNNSICFMYGLCTSLLKRLNVCTRICFETTFRHCGIIFLPTMNHWHLLPVCVVAQGRTHSHDNRYGVARFFKSLIMSLNKSQGRHSITIDIKSYDSFINGKTSLSCILFISSSLFVFS